MQKSTVSIDAKVVHSKCLNNVALIIVTALAAKNVSVQAKVQLYEQYL